MVRTESKTSFLQGKRVAFTGRLASMTRRDAARLVAHHGGRLATTVSPNVSVLVIGREGWPLAKDGRPTRKLRKARWLASRGHDVAILSEDTLLAKLSVVGDSRLQRRATLAELTDLVGVSRDRLRRWMQWGLIRPAEEADGIGYFDFCQVAGAKTLCDLLRTGVTVARLRRSLQQLQAWLIDASDSLAQLAILEQHGHLLLRLEGGRVAEPSGQLHFDFSELAGPPAVPWAPAPRTADEWLEIACRAEDQGDLAEAELAYRQTLLLGGPSAETCFGLGNVLYARGDIAAARERFQQAIELAPTFCEAWNNLGTVLANSGQVDNAMATYRKAIALDPHFADAHFNLADCLEECGQPDEAHEHWQAYLRFDPTGPWADHARARVGEERP